MHRLQDRGVRQLGAPVLVHSTCLLSAPGGLAEATVAAPTLGWRLPSQREGACRGALGRVACLETEGANSGSHMFPDTCRGCGLTKCLS